MANNEQDLANAIAMAKAGAAPAPAQPAPSDDNMIIRLLKSLMGGKSDVAPIQKHKNEVDQLIQDM